MSETIKSKIGEISHRMCLLSAQGVKIVENHSGELNSNGCASGYCQAWA